MKADTVVNWH